MSMNLMAKAMSIKVGNPLRKLVLIKLADNANDKGECWPSYQHIADQCEISKRSVMRHIDDLCEVGMLRKEYRPGPKGNSSNVYHLSLDGDRKSLGVMTESHPPSDRESLPPSDRESPRTSHSFEPVIEPKETPVAKASPQCLTDSSRYAFEGKIVKLNHDDFKSWTELYSSIDLVYELQKLDIEFSHEKPKNWFITASQKINYQNKQAVNRGIAPGSVEQTPHWNSPEGWEDFI